jgi:hypothetical protein
MTVKAFDCEGFMILPELIIISYFNVKVILAGLSAMGMKIARKKLL